MVHGVADVVLLVLLTVGTVAVIVIEQRLPCERVLRDRYGVDRDWWVPIGTLGVAIVLGLVRPATMQTVFVEKFDILALIMVFGFLSEGLRASGVFQHFAYRVVDSSGGRTGRLIFSLFVMTAVVTVFTTNDVVVLVMTPLTITICFQIGLTNPKLVLLSQFIAANTLSMWLVIGSPTNLIIAEAMNIDFFEYLQLMWFPTVVAFAVSAVLVYATIRVVHERSIPGVERLSFQAGYSVPDENPAPRLTSQMAHWIGIFGVLVGLVAVATFYHASLLWCVAPGMGVAVAYWRASDAHTEPLHGPLSRLPYGILPFGMTFFVFAAEVVAQPAIRHEFVPALNQFFASAPLQTAIFGIFGSGVLVNVFNDLPAAAIIAELLTSDPFNVGAITPLFKQTLLVGLNIGRYVTHVGALAGIIWFHQLRIERDRHAETHPDLAAAMTIPKRRDLLWYGTLHFCLVGLCSSALLVLTWTVRTSFWG